MANLKDIVATLAILSAGSLALTGCKKEGETTNPDEVKADDSGGEAADGGDGEASCGAADGAEGGEGSCGAADGEAEGGEAEGGEAEGGEAGDGEASCSGAA